MIRIGRIKSGHIVLAATADICWALCIMQIETTPHQPVNHVFVDLENVKVIDASVLGGKHLRLSLFLGPQNKKLEVEWAGLAERVRNLR